MMIRRIISLVLCFVVVYHLSTPIVHASNTNVAEQGRITSCETLAVYTYYDSIHQYTLVLDKQSGAGSFAFVNNSNPDYIYECYFSIPVNTIDISSHFFWMSLTESCLSGSDLNVIHTPSAIKVSTIYTSIIPTTRATPTYENQMMTWATTQFGGAYTGSVLASGFKGSTMFQVFEDHSLGVTKNDAYEISQALSIASLITKVFKQKITSTLLSLLSKLIGSTVPAGEILYYYSIGEQKDRYVKRKDSSVWLNITQRFITYNAYVVKSTGEWGVDESSRTAEYSDSQSYFEDLYAQIDDGYEYYLLS